MARPVLLADGFQRLPPDPFRFLVGIDRLAGLITEQDTDRGGIHDCPQAAPGFLRFDQQLRVRPQFFQPANQEAADGKHEEQFRPVAQMPKWYACAKRCQDQDQ